MELTAVALKLADSLLATRARLKVGYKNNIGNRLKVNKYYDLVTGFYEYGWGDSFHFVGRDPGETIREGIKRHQHFMALQLGLKKDMKLSTDNWIEQRLPDLKGQGDFMNMPIADNTFDVAYAIDATCHAPDAQGVYSEVYRVLKPGQCFALAEWRLTDRFDPNNAKHLTIKAEIELGDGLPDIRTTRQCVQAMKDAGFEVSYSCVINR
ncbi:unnamed protein product [Miscanthus lutarioriparius]|uniref:SAM-dependent methyltransferase Erg6/SMT-type domain-containing protein n=1 Tax=Miscanthus lutarioriparius TaxID=422564 RepID=A0A811N0I3_9POAL|nr:unnamed protein product [Miscanthus lutarioriparius]